MTGLKNKTFRDKLLLYIYIKGFLVKTLAQLSRNFTKLSKNLFVKSFIKFYQSFAKLRESFDLVF